MRDIHWKLNSKNDELLSRCYMEEGESGISFYLNVSGWKDGGWKEQSASLRLDCRMNLYLDNERIGNFTAEEILSQEHMEQER